MITRTEAMKRARAAIKIARLTGWKLYLQVARNYLLCAQLARSSEQLKQAQS